MKSLPCPDLIQAAKMNLKKATFGAGNHHRFYLNRDGDRWMLSISCGRAHLFKPKLSKFDEWTSCWVINCIYMAKALDH